MAKVNKDDIGAIVSRIDAQTVVTEEDWDSDTANTFAFVSVFAFYACAFTIAFELVFVIHPLSFVFAIITSFTLAIILLPLNFLSLSPDTVPSLVDSKPFLFPGAYLHYRKRMSKQKEV